MIWTTLCRRGVGRKGMDLESWIYLCQSMPLFVARVPGRSVLQKPRLAPSASAVGKWQRVRPGEPWGGEVVVCFGPCVRLELDLDVVADPAAFVLGLWRNPHVRTVGAGGKLHTVPDDRDKAVAAENGLWELHVGKCALGGVVAREADPAEVSPHLLESLAVLERHVDHREARGGRDGDGARRSIHQVLEVGPGSFPSSHAVDERVEGLHHLWHARRK
mmetsp:Transcript_32658/g.85519  ORF Transcript_32658/g.85519 Transcript_32658/m.85519 type:complete len:218 (+) Transcript_32658:834-1487(+)